jgi:hypothetical protein
MTSSAKAWTAAATQLTDRDRYLCRLLFEHDVLTTPQIGQIAFSGERRTRQRLALLASLSVLESVRPDRRAVHFRSTGCLARSVHAL